MLAFLELGLNCGNTTNTTETVTRRCSIKNMFLKLCKIYSKTSVSEFFLKNKILHQKYL